MLVKEGWGSLWIDILCTSQLWHGCGLAAIKWFNLFSTPWIDFNVYPTLSYSWFGLSFLLDFYSLAVGAFSVSYSLYFVSFVLNWFRFLKEGLVCGIIEDNMPQWSWIWCSRLLDSTTYNWLWLENNKFLIEYDFNALYDWF